MKLTSPLSRTIFRTYGNARFEMRLVRAAGFLLATVIGIVSIQEQADASPKQQKFETLVSTRSTPFSTDSGFANVSWNIFSDVGPVERAAVDPRAPGAARFLREMAAAGLEESLLYRYTYTFRNPSSFPVKLNFADPKVANSALITVLNDYSFTLAPGETRTVRFLTVHAPDFVTSSVNNGIWDSRASRWDMLGSGPASLYIPAWDGPIFVEAQ
jgi:hypothetical protein